MMDYEYNKIYEALRTLKEVCGNDDDCNECPLGNSDGLCKLNDQIPYNWEVNEPPTKEVFRFFGGAE